MVGRATATSRNRRRGGRRGRGAMGPWQCDERHCRGGVPWGRRLGPAHAKPATQPRIREGHEKKKKKTQGTTQTQPAPDGQGAQ